MQELPDEVFSVPLSGLKLVLNPITNGDGEKLPYKDSDLYCDVKNEGTEEVTKGELKRQEDGSIIVRVSPGVVGLFQGYLILYFI